MKSNGLANLFSWLGDALEQFNPSAYKFLAAVLPYMTPIPVAWLTSASASEFLNLPPGVAFILVFALEGIGLWFTSLLVDAIVDWIRSRNWKTFALVIMFGAVVTVYITILVNLNVTLEQARNVNANPALSRVITLMCFLPLLTGVGNGYYKLKLDAKAKEVENREYERTKDEKDKERAKDERLQKYRIKHGERTNVVTNELTTNAVRTNVRKPATNERSQRTNGELRTFVLAILDEYARTNGEAAGVSAIAKEIAKKANAANGIPNSEQGYERYKGYVSEVRSSWLIQNPEYRKEN